MKKSLFLFLVFLFFSLSFSQNNWIEKTDWKSLESFEKNKQKQLSFILLEGAGELKQVNNRPQPGLEDVLSNFNCTKIKLENQKIQFKNRTFKKNKNENLHEFERFLVGEENTNLLSLKPLIIILDENFNLIEFSFFNKIEKSKEDQNILIEAEKLKLEYLKKQISDTTHKAIVRTEAALKRLRSNNKSRNQQESVFVFNRYNNPKLPHLLMYFFNKDFQDISLANYFKKKQAPRENKK